MPWVLQCGTDSATQITVNPEFDYAEPDRKVENRHRMRSAAEFVYKWAEYRRHIFTWRFVSSADATIVNSWWSSNSELLFMKDDGTDVSSVRITASEKPITNPIIPYNESQLQGLITLEAY